MSQGIKMAAVGTLLGGAVLLALAGLFADPGKGPAFWTERAATAPSAEPMRPYSVTLSPMGEVRFDHVPRRIVTLDANYNDMLVALGEEHKLAATGYRGNFFDGFYAQLPGVKVRLEAERLTYLASAGGGMFDKELLYALRADVHHIDPLQLAASRGWSRADVEEIARNVGPFVANRYSRDHNYPGPEPYAYYTVWELSAKIAEVYRKPERITQLQAIYSDLLQAIQAKLPPKEKRPRVALIFYNNGRFTPYSIIHEGFGQAQYRDVGARDAFASIEARTYGGAGGAGGIGTALDAEGLLAIDPEVLIMPFAIYPATQTGTSRTNFEQLLKLKDDPLLQRLSAFRTGRVYPGGTPLQGPLFYLFQIEMAAKQIYPEIFGPYRDDQNYPPQEQLFDREKVAKILMSNTGEHNDQP